MNSEKSPLRLIVLLASIATALLGSVSTASAAAYVYTGGGAGTATQPVSGNWNEAASWDNGIPPSSVMTDLSFGSATTNLAFTATNDIPGTLTINDLTLASGVAAGTVTLAPAASTNRLAFGDDGLDTPTITNSGSAVNSMNIGFDLLSNLSVVQNSNAQLNITVAVANTGIDLGSHVLSFTGTGTGTIQTGSPNVVGSGLISGTGSIVINRSGTTAFAGASTYSGGTTLTNGLLVVNTSSVGTIGNLTSGSLGTGTLTINGGSVRSTTVGARSIGNSVTVNADFGVPSVSNARDLTFTGAVTLNGIRTITSATTASTFFNGPLGESVVGAGLIKAGTGAIFLGNATNTYTGATSVREGSLIVSGTLSGAVNVGNPTTPATVAGLRGSGTLPSLTSVGSGSAATTGAFINPGNSTAVRGGILTVSGALSVTNGAELRFEIGGLTAGGEVATGYDRIVTTTGTVDVSNADLGLVLSGTPTFAPGSLLFLVVNGSSTDPTGTFGTLNNAAFDPNNISFGGAQFQLSYAADLGSNQSFGGNDIALVAVPEPTSGILLLGCLGAILASRRRIPPQVRG